MKLLKLLIILCIFVPLDLYAKKKSENQYKKQTISSHLNKTKDALNTRKIAKQKAQADLTALRSQLAGQQSAIASAQAEKTQLLADTKESQSEYQKILDQKQALKDSFEQEMQSLEESLHDGLTKSR